MSREDVLKIAEFKWKIDEIIRQLEKLDEKDSLIASRRAELLKKLKELESKQLSFLQIRMRFSIDKLRI